MYNRFGDFYVNYWATVIDVCSFVAVSFGPISLALSLLYVTISFHEPCSEFQIGACPSVYVVAGIVFSCSGMSGRACYFTILIH